MYLHFQSLDDYSLDALAILSLHYNLDFRCIFYGTFTSTILPPTPLLCVYYYVLCTTHFTLQMQIHT